MRAFEVVKWRCKLFQNRRSGQTETAISTAEKTSLQIAPSDALERDATMTTTNTTKPLLMRGKEACDLLGISRWTLRVLAAAGEVRPVKVSRQNRYLTEDVMRMVETSKPRSLELVSPKKASQMLGSVSTRTITRMADNGQLRFVVTPGGHRRVYVEDVRKLIALGQGVDHVGADTESGTEDSD